MRLPSQLPLEQAQAQVAELARLRVLVQAAVLELAQMQAQRLVQALELQLELEPPLVRVQGWESARQQESAVEPEQVRELRVSRQQEQQQHRLLAAVQELLPYLPALPKKALC